MNEEKTTHEPKKEGTPNQGHLQSYIQNFTKEAIDAIVAILRTTRNENLKMGAAKVIIDKSIADIKSIELSGKDGSPIRVQLINDYLSTSGVAISSPTTSSSGQDTIQSFSVAPPSQEDINSVGESGPGSPQSAP